MSCKNNFIHADDILFKTKILNENSFTLTKDREFAFYFICIPLRLVIFLSILMIYLFTQTNSLTQKIISIILLIIYIISFVINIMKSEEQKQCQWWSNNLEIILPSIVIGFSFFSFFYLKNFSYPILVASLVFLTSLIAGLIQSFIKQPFKI